MRGTLAYSTVSIQANNTPPNVLTTCTPPIGTNTSSLEALLCMSDHVIAMRMCTRISDTSALGSVPQAVRARGQTVAATTAVFLTTFHTLCTPFPFLTLLFRSVALFRAPKAVKHALAILSDNMLPDASVFDTLGTSFYCGYGYAQGLNNNKKESARS